MSVHFCAWREHSLSRAIGLWGELVSYDICKSASRIGVQMFKSDHWRGHDSFEALRYKTVRQARGANGAHIFRFRSWSRWSWRSSVRSFSTIWTSSITPPSATTKSSGSAARRWRARVRTARRPRGIHRALRKCHAKIAAKWHKAALPKQPTAANGRMRPRFGQRLRCKRAAPASQGEDFDETGIRGAFGRAVCTCSI